MSIGPGPIAADANRIYVYREVVDRRAVRKVPGRRRTLRYKYLQPCSIRVSRGYVEVTLHSWCEDLGEISMRATVAEDLLPGEIVRIDLPLDCNPETLVVHAVVRRRDGATYGLEFLDLEPDQRLTLRMHLHSSPGTPVSSSVPPWL